MKTTEKGVNLVQDFEGFRAKPYYCPAGKLTVGYGHVIQEDEGHLKSGVTQDHAELLLKQDLIIAETAVNRYVKVPLSRNQFDALVSFIFNIGVSAFKSSTLLKLLNKGKHEEVPAQLARWNKITSNGKKIVSRGLVRRRQAEADLWIADDKPQEMPQEIVKPDKSLVKSKTVANASLVGITGAVLTVAPAVEPAGKVIELAHNNTQGFLLTLGLVLIGCAAFAIYLRYKAKVDA